MRTAFRQTDCRGKPGKTGTNDVDRACHQMKA
jgi:hypothetical protein